MDVRMYMPMLPVHVPKQFSARSASRSERIIRWLNQSINVDPLLVASRDDGSNAIIST